MDCELGNVEANAQKIKNIIDEYRGKVDFLVFPELALTGYCVGEKFHEYSLITDDDIFQDILNHTKDISIALGFIEETTSINFYNSLAFIKNCKISHIHRKIYLPNYGIFEERKYFKSGTSANCFEQGPFRISPFICGDAWNPALVHLAAADHAHILSFSVCSPENGLGSRLSTKESWKRLNRFYATMYGSFVVFVNRVGREKNLKFWGESEVIDPFGQVIASAKSDSEEVITTSIHLSQIREARNILHTIRDEDLDFIQKRLERIMDRYYL